MKSTPLLSGLITICLAVPCFGVVPQAPFSVYSIGSAFGSDSSAIIRCEPTAVPLFGACVETLLEDQNSRYDIETDGNSLFIVEDVSPSGRRRLAQYTLEGTFEKELADLSGIDPSIKLMYESGQFYVQDYDHRVVRINSDGTYSDLGSFAKGGIDAFPGGFVASDYHAIGIFDQQGQLLSETKVDFVVEGIAIDDARRIAYATSIFNDWGVIDFSDPLNPFVVTQGTAGGGLFHPDFDPVTGNIFGSEFGAIAELHPDGTLVRRYVGGPYAFKIGVAVVHIPEPHAGIAWQLAAALVVLGTARHRRV